MPTITHHGCPIAYDIHGRGPPVLFIQGVGVHGPGWRPQIDALANDFTCLSFDNRGLGRSRPSTAPITVEQMADDARAVLDAAGIDRAHVVGHSLGGLVAQIFALNNRARVKSLSLLCTFANGREVAPLTPRMLWLGLRTKLGTHAMRRRGFLRLVLPPGHAAHSESELADLFGHDLVNLPDAANLQLKALRAANAWPRLPELVGLSTMVLSARYDLLAPPPLGRAIASAITGANFEEFPDASHGLPITHATAVNVRLAQQFAKSD